MNIGIINSGNNLTPETPQFVKNQKFTSGKIDFSNSTIQRIAAPGFAISCRIEQLRQVRQILKLFRTLSGSKKFLTYKAGYT